MNTRLARLASSLTSDEAAFIATLGHDLADWLTPLIYADWLEERGDPRGKLLRVWVDLARNASHAAHGFRDLLAEYRRLWAVADSAWRRTFGAARPWVNAELAEELARAYLRYVEERPPERRGVIPDQTRWFEEPFATGWLVSYWTGHGHPDRRRQKRESKWMLFVQSELGWVYGVATCGPKLWLNRYDVASGQGHAF